jgi:hypothetical protein
MKIYESGKERIQANKTDEAMLRCFLNCFAAQIAELIFLPVPEKDHKGEKHEPPFSIHL